ncbi:hypothetical protein GCM10017600_61570 [Streptosporangium carneum]|uniref:Carrier domain-containing protein n=2 Tax=Streptosporangium carneum TaxID=47481 RepID=A0A9W6MG45_9ACTN|nr:hypothetical protein GCM10017600_61570 [Streptosporangium carneum]
MFDIRPSPISPSHDDGHLRSICELFAEQAQSSADSLAVVHGSNRLTYRELHSRATAVAERLAALGIRDGALVALSFPRSADAVVCMLGVLMAGGAYLPVNPEFPGERVTRVLEDSRAALLVCDAESEARIAPAVPRHTELLSLTALLTRDGAPELRPAYLDPAEGGASSPLAYVMYTSGSTGRPKGVMVEHAGVVRLVRGADYFEFSAAERFLQTGALEFDASTFEIWGALLNGATLHIVDHDVLLVPARFRQAMHDADITVLWLTAPLFNQMVDEDVTVFARLRTLLVGGDVLSHRHVNLVRKACPQLRVINGYGPTENTTFTTTFPIERDYAGPIPIGRAINGTTVAVLDSARLPAAVGEVGELYVAGAGLARGYLNNPELTAESFVVLDGVRHYRTGDLVSDAGDGVLSFHGRVDNQVKIRGHRVEIQEIDSALLEIPGLVDTHTHVETGPDDVKRIISHVVLAPGCDEEDLLPAIRLRLPAYMCPDRVVRMDRLPLNANGKVDRTRLPDPPPVRRVGRPPETASELALARLWADILCLEAETLGAEDDFFLLGGSSITVGGLIGRIARTLGVTVGFGQLFEARTLSEMARILDTANGAELSAIERREPDDGVLHPQQQALYALWQVNQKSLVYNIPVKLQVDGPLNPQRLRTALAALFSRHDVLRTRFATTADGVRRVVEEEAPVDLRVVEADQAPPTERELLPLLVHPFDLGSLPLLRVLLVRGDPAGDLLYLDVHHIVFDGVSLRLFVEELFDLYEGFLPEAPAVSYADAARWATGRLEGPESERAERYWMDRFAAPVPALDLPTDRPRPPLRSTEGDVVVRRLSPEPVRRIMRRESVTSFVVLLTAYAAALARLSGQRDLAIGSPMSGRPHPDLESVVGMFVNTVVLRARLRPAGTLTDLLQDLAAEHIGALEHQEYPFTRLVRRLDVPRDLSRNALFDAFFALQNIDFHSFRKHGRRITLSLPHVGTCRFDLNLQAFETPNGYSLELEYSTALFGHDSVAFLLDKVVEILDELHRNPGNPVLPQPETGTAQLVDAADFTF